MIFFLGMTPSSAAQFAALASSNTAAAAFTQPTQINNMQIPAAAPIINTIQAVPAATNSNFCYKN